MSLESFGPVLHPDLILLLHFPLLLLLLLQLLLLVLRQFLLARQRGGGAVRGRGPAPLWGWGSEGGGGGGVGGRDRRDGPQRVDGRTGGEVRGGRRARLIRCNIVVSVFGTTKTGTTTVSDLFRTFDVLIKQWTSLCEASPQTAIIPPIVFFTIITLSW